MRGSMKNCFKGLLVIGVLAFFSIGQAVAAMSTFDTDLDGWTYTNLNPRNDNPASLTWAGTGGNPGGFVQFTDLRGDHGAIAAPDKFKGDWGNVVSIDYDIKVIDYGTGPRFLPYEVRLFNSDANISARWTGDTPTSRTDWVHQSVMLNDTAWDVTGGNLVDLLANVTDFFITIELVSDAHFDIEGIDNVNVSAVPIPAALWLFTSGIAGLVVQAKRKRQSV